jgi:hypothetical protein
MSGIRVATTTGPGKMAMLTRAVAILTFVVLAGPAAAHPALYHYLEINLLEPGEVSVYVTLHAPELIEGVVKPGDDLYGREWLATRDDAALAVLVENAGEFATAVFSFRFGNREVQPDFVFPDFETIRRPPPGSVVPEGCFSGGVTVPCSRGEADLTIDFSPMAEKRLMLIINRPSAFPEVIDLEPGGRYVLALPEAPTVTRGIRGFMLIPAILFVALVIALIRRRRACHW